MVVIALDRRAPAAASRDQPRAGVEDYCLVKAARDALARAEERASRKGVSLS